MSGYLQAIAPPQSVRCSELRVSSWASLFLPSLGSVIFGVTLLHVVFLSEGVRVLFRDSDTGWHIRIGEAIVASRSVPSADSFSYTHGGREWFAWEWLADVLLGSAHAIAGPPGVAVLAALGIALAAWGAARLALSLGGNLFFTAGATVLLLGTTSIHWLARPHIFSWLLALIFVAVAERQRLHTSRALYWLPALACLWANLHGSFLLGPGILFLYALGEWLQGRKHQRAGRQFAAASLCSLLATFANPYGWQLHAHVLAYLRNTYLMDHISEFRSFNFHAPGAIYVELFLLVATVSGVALVHQRAYGPALLTLALLHLSLYSARHLPTSAVVVLPLCVAALTRETEDWTRLQLFHAYSERLHRIDQRILGVAPVIVVLVATLVGVHALARDNKVGFDPTKFPVGAASFLEQHGLQRRVFAKDQWGGYLIYRFQGRLKVFIDGRSDLYGQDLLESYAQVVEVRPGWETVLAQMQVRFVLIPPDHALASALQLSREWKRVYADSVATVFERVS